jgi:transposase
LEVVGQRIESGRAVLACRVVESDVADGWCRRCGCQGVVRGTVLRRLAHEPLGWRPTILEVRVRRYRCSSCGKVWRQDTSCAAEPRAKLSRRGLRWALEGLVVQHLTVARVAEALAVSWNTANDAVLAEGRRVLIDDPARFDGVRVIGVDEHVWRHTRRGDRFVTVVIDLTAVRDGTGPARLLDMVEGRSKQAFQQWLSQGEPAWRAGVEVVAMDGFTGFKTATTEELPDATAVMDPFHVVRLAGDALDHCRRRVQQDLHGNRGRAGDTLYAARRVLHTGADLLTSKQKDRLTTLFTVAEHVEVEATWGVYQRMIAAYREPDRAHGRAMMQDLITSLARAVPAALSEVATLGRTLTRRADDVTLTGPPLPPVRLHDLRHGAASLTYRATRDLKLVSELLGHSGIQITADTYTTLFQEVDVAAAEAVAKLVPRRVVHTMCTPADRRTGQPSTGSDLR